MRTEITRETKDAFYRMEGKYFALVWYARSRPRQDTEYWQKVSSSIREGAFNSQERVEAAYPLEVIALEDDWNHGFNSGCLAAFRYVLSALDKDLGIPVAEEEFPSLDT